MILWRDHRQFRVLYSQNICTNNKIVARIVAVNMLTFQPRRPSARMPIICRPNTDFGEIFGVR
jgi:hypothetical protein